MMMGDVECVHEYANIKYVKLIRVSADADYYAKIFIGWEAY